MNHELTYILYEVYTRPVVHPFGDISKSFGKGGRNGWIVHPMFDFLLYAGIHCVDAEDMIRRIELNDSVSKVIRTEVIETVKEATPECNWDIND